MRIKNKGRPKTVNRRVALAAMAVAAFEVNLAPPALSQETEQAVLKPLSVLAATYRIEIVATKPAFPVKSKHGFTHGRTASSDALTKYTPLFVKEFQRYPQSFVVASRLKRIVLCEDLSFDGQRRSAVPDFEHNALYLDVKRGDHNAMYQRKVMHHEFFHIVDFVDDGEVYRDDQWAAMNAKEFRYGTGGRNAQDIATTSVLTDRFPGFLNHYSTTGVEEDKAEMFANLLVEYRYVMQRATRDAVVQQKVDAMKKLLAEFCVDLDAKFWERLSIAR